MAENSGHFLYVYQSGGSPGVVVYSLGQATGGLAQVLGPLSGIQFANGSTVADPMGAYIYSARFATPTLTHAYQVDSTTGNLTEISGSPFNAGASANCCGGLAISGNPTQAVSGPAVSIFPSTATCTSVVGVPGPINQRSRSVDTARTASHPAYLGSASAPASFAPSAVFPIRTSH